jgi:murein L,D-transpeptidase YcbB/YkuD
MTGWTFGRLAFCLTCGVALAATLAPTVQAAKTHALGASLASDLVQNRALISLFRHDDQMDLGCKDKRISSSAVVTQPHVVNQKLNERKWVERWAVDRCGQEVQYHVYFTTVGDGGAYFSFKEVDQADSIPVHYAAARTLKLQKPLMKGKDVRALQVALLNQGIEVSTDGVFGPATRKAVMTYQKKQGLAADGIAGPATSKSLGISG